MARHLRRTVAGSGREFFAGHRRVRLEASDSKAVQRAVAIKHDGNRQSDSIENVHYGIGAFMTGLASPISEYISAHGISLSVLSPFLKSHAPTPPEAARKMADISEVEIAILELLVSFW